MAIPANSPLPSPRRPAAAAVRLVEYDEASALTGGNAAARAADVVLIHVDGNKGFAGGNNVGLHDILAAKDATHVWPLNNDMVVATEGLGLMVERLTRDPGLGAIGATLLEYREPDVVQAAGAGRLVAWQGLPRPHSTTGQRRGRPGARNPDRLDFITMGCLVTRVEVLERIGLIDPRYFIGCQDIDCSLRLIAAGYRIGFVPEAEGWHKASASRVPGSARHDYHLVRSSLLLAQKFYPRLMPIAFAHPLARCAAPKVVRREGERLRAVLRAYRNAASWNERAA